MNSLDNRPGPRYPLARVHLLLQILASWLGMFPLLAQFVLPGLPPAEGWTPRPNPNGGWWHDLVLSADGRIVAATAYSWNNRTHSISTDSGRTWQALTLINEFPNASVIDLALSGDGSRIVAAILDAAELQSSGTESWSVLLSADQGKHWQSIPAPPFSAIRSIRISRDGLRVAVVEPYGIRLTSDWGRNWTFSPFPAGAPERTAEQVRLSLSADGKTVLAATPSHPPLISHDFGNTWVRADLRGVDGQVLEIGPAALSGDGQHLALATRIAPPGQQGPSTRTNAIVVLTSSNGGQDWQQTSIAIQNNEIPTYIGDYSPAGLAISDDGRHILMGTGVRYGWGWQGSTVVSSDSGQTWRQISPQYAPLVAMSAGGNIQLAAVASVNGGDGTLFSFGVGYPPEIQDVKQIGDLDLSNDLSVTLSVTATGSWLNYQWRRDGVDVQQAPHRSGLGTSLLTLSPVTVADQGTYSVIVSNSEGSVEREVGRIEITTPQVLGVSQVGGPALIDGAPVTFAVQAQGGLLSYQWQRNGVMLEDGPGLSGVHTRELKLPVANDGHLGTYSVVISNPLGIVTTNVGMIQLTVPKVLGTRQVGGPMIQLGDSSRLEFNAEGGQANVEWLRNGLPLGTAGIWTGPGTNQLILTNLAAEDLGEYSVRLRNTVGESVFVIGRVSQASWLKANVASESWNSIAVSQDGRHLIATSPSQIVTSEDGGATWNTLAAPGTDWTSVALGSDSGRVFLGQGNDFTVSNQPTSWVISSDLGNTWTSWTDPGNGQDGIWHTKAAACSSDGMTLLLSQDIPVTGSGWLPRPFKIGRLRISRDGGLTWQTASTNPSDNQWWRSVSCSLDGKSMAAIRYDPFNRWYQIYYSPNSGSTWRSTALPEPSIWSVRVSGDGRRLIAIGGKGMYACNTGSLSWVKLPTPLLAWNAISVSEDGQRILAADYGSADTGGLMYQSSDAGQTWRWTGSPSANWTAIACSADGERVVGVSPQGIFLSPTAATAAPTAALIQAGNDASGVSVLWQGIPHRTYRLISTPSLDGQPWNSAGAVVADSEGRVLLSEPATEAQRFWQALEVE